MPFGRSGRLRFPQMQRVLCICDAPGAFSMTRLDSASFDLKCRSSAFTLLRQRARYPRSCVTGTQHHGTWAPKWSHQQQCLPLRWRQLGNVMAADGCLGDFLAPPQAGQYVILSQEHKQDFLIRFSFLKPFHCGTFTAPSHSPNSALPA